MTSLRRLVAFLSLFSTLSLALPWAGSVSAQAPAPVQAGQAVAVVGAASIVRPTVREPLRQGARVDVGDRIVTGADARVRIRLVDGAALVVGPRSEIVVRAAGTWGRRRTVALNLVFGIARAIAPANHRSALEIWTSAAIASVRHTDWIVVVRADRTAVFAVDGTVDVTDRSDGQRRILRKANGIDLMADGRVIGPQPWGAARVASVLATTTLP